MTAPYEAEVRFAVPEIETFRRRIAALGGRLEFRYAFTDHYLRPRVRGWDLRRGALRVREHRLPEPGSELLLTRIEQREIGGLAFKRSLLPEGKVSLYRGDTPGCLAVASALGFEPWFDVEKAEGEFYRIADLGAVVAERVAGLGWTSEVEVEGADPEAAAGSLRRKLEALDVSVAEASAEPLAVIAARALGVLPPPGPLRVYFCGAIRGGRELQPLYERVIGHLQRRGYEVLTSHVGRADVLEREQPGGERDRAIFERDLAWLHQSDLVIAEVTVPSLGVGVEIALAVGIGRRVVCLARHDAALSALVSGWPALEVHRYLDEAEALAVVDRALDAVEAA